LENIDNLLKENKMIRTKLKEEDRILVNYCIKFLENVKYHVLFKRFIAFFLYRLGIQTGIIALTCKYSHRKNKEIRKINKLYETGGPFQILPGNHPGRKKKITPEIHMIIIKLIIQHRTISSRKISTLLLYKYNIDISYKVIEKEINTYNLKQLLDL